MARQPESPEARHKPATALSWRAQPRDDLLTTGERKGCYWEFEGGSGYLDSDLGFCLTGYIHPDDARYLLHAANVYPKLIAALQENARLWQHPDDIALLSELGEL